MPCSLLHFVLVHQGQADKPRVLHLGVEPDGGGGASGAVTLLVLDARRMNPACLQAAFTEVIRLRREPGVKHSVLVCDGPHLALVLGAMRAGLRDIIHEPLTARQIVRMLRVATPGHRACVRQVSALAALVRTVSATSRPPGAAALAGREYALVQRAERLDHTETRLALQRASLEDREQKLRAGTRRLERELTALQNDPDIPRPAPRPASTPTATPFSAPPFVTDLQAIAAQLAERAHALDIRERMLQEMETLLTAQLVGADGRPAESWRTVDSR